jgi:hypothetical protein
MHSFQPIALLGRPKTGEQQTRRAYTTHTFHANFILSLYMSHEPQPEDKHHKETQNVWVSATLFSFFISFSYVLKLLMKHASYAGHLDSSPDCLCFITFHERHNCLDFNVFCTLCWQF